MLIENYKELLFAILNSDYDKKRKKSILCVYDTKDNDRLIGVFNSTRTCANFFNTNVGVIKSTISRNNLRNHRYRIERVELGSD